MITEQEVKSKTPERFWSKIKFDDFDKCWEWTGSLKGQGFKIGNAYGSYGIKKGKKWTKISAHRFVALELFPKFDLELCVLHKCDNRKCCNPNHLFLGTDKDNTDDMIAKGRARKGDKKGQNNPHSHFTDEEVRQIKTRLLHGEKRSKIAKEFGVHNDYIGNIYHGKTWKHIPTWS